MRCARCCALSPAACVEGDRLAAVVVRLALTAAFVGGGVAVVPPCALEGAGFRFAGLLGLDLDVVLVSFASMKPDMRIARPCANLWRSDGAGLGDTLRVDKSLNTHILRRRSQGLARDCAAIFAARTA